MTTKNLVPRATGEGSLGTSSLKWGTINALTGSFDATQFEALKNGADNDLLVAGSNVTITYASGANGNQYTIAASSTPITGVLEDLETLGTSASDGEFIVATEAGAFAYESGATVRTSLGLGTGDSPTFTSLTLSGQSSSLAMNSQKITGLGTPTADSDAATKAYVDGVAQGLDIYDTVVAATTASFTMTSTASTTTLVLADGEGGFSASADTFTVDGVSLSQDDRVLIKDGVNSNSEGVSNKWNGIYTVGDLTAASLTLTRSTDMDVPSEFNTGAFFFVEQGTTNADNGFVLTTDGTVTVGTSDIEFTQFSGAGDVTAGDGLSKTGNTLFVDSTVITAQTSISTPNVLDSFLLSDADDSNNLKRATLSDIVTGIFDTQSGSTTIADNDLVLIYDTSEGSNRIITKANFASGLGGISNVVEDTTPQLGGNLDLNANAIVQTNANDMTLHVSGSDQDIVFTGNDGGSPVTALTLDMSAEGTAIFNHDIKLGNGEVFIQHSASPKGLDITVTSGAGDYEPMLRLKASDGAATGSFIVHQHAGLSAFNTAPSAGDIIGGTVYRTGTISTDDHAIFQTVWQANTHSDYEIKVRSNSSVTNGITIEGHATQGPKVIITDHDGTNSGLCLGYSGSAPNLVPNLVTATAAELNIMDGDTSAVSTTLVDADRVVVNDNGTMKQVALTDMMTYVNANVSGSSVALNDIGVGDSTSTLATTVGDIIIHTQGVNSDIRIRGNDGGSTITPLMFDMSDNGKALFSTDIFMNGTRNIDFYRYANSQLGAIRGIGTNNAATDVTFNSIEFEKSSGSIGSENGKILFKNMFLGSFDTSLEISSDGVYQWVDIPQHNGSSNRGLALGGVGVSATANELNILDGVTATTAELNILDGGTTATATMLVDADRVVVNDAGTMKQVAMSDVKTYINAISNVVEDTTPQLGGNLDVNGNDIVTTSNADLDLAPDGTGVVVLKGNTTGGNNPGAIKLNCEQNSHGITIKSPLHSSAATYTLTLPDTDGNASEVLQTDGSGNLSWVAQSSGGGTSYTYSAITSGTTTAQAWYHYSIDASGGTVTLNLPALSGLTDGDEIRVKVRDNTNTVTIDANSTETIDGNETLVLNTQYEAVTLVAGSTEWEII